MYLIAIGQLALSRALLFLSQVVDKQSTKYVEWLFFSYGRIYILIGGARKMPSSNLVSLNIVVWKGSRDDN